MAVSAVGAQPAAAPATSTGSRVERWRRLLLSALVAGCIVAAGTGAVVLIANQITYDRYGSIVNTGAVSVDAAQDARAHVLDNVAWNAGVLVAQTQDARTQQRTNAANSWEVFKNDLRRSWQNLSDVTQGELAVFKAADLASTSYEGSIGAMNAALDANPPRLEDAHAAFLQAYTVLQQRLVPALGGMQAVKVEDMNAAYASTSNTVLGWLVAVVAFSLLLLAITIFGLRLTRGMHHRLTIELALAVLIALAVAGWVGLQLRRADTQAKQMVDVAYNTVAGVRDEIALVSQQHALESIAIFDAQNAQTHFAELDAFTLLVETGLCGDRGCTSPANQQKTFLAASPASPSPTAAIDPEVRRLALDSQDRYGLPRPPLVGNVHFKGEAQALEDTRLHYLAFLKADQALRAPAIANNTAAAAAASAGPSATEYAATVASLERARAAAHGVYDSIWRSVQDASRIGELLAAGELVVALLLARGLWRRRAELYPANAR